MMQYICDVVSGLEKDYDVIAHKNSHMNYLVKT